MYAIKCNGSFVHAIIPDDFTGITYCVVSSPEDSYLRFDDSFSAVCIVQLLLDKFPTDEFVLCKVFG